ncbi:MAG: peptidylprolyl isomerase [Deltaproteobacteria bacterium]|nr:peptidylprolyl isomerase [Deltaproteobacteria bacterium]
MKIYKISILLLLILGLTGCKSPAATDSSKSTSAKTETNQVCPDEYTVKLKTTQGDILIDVKKEWAPLGAQRFYTLVKENYYTDVAFFRVIDGFIAQFGISGDPELNTKWRNNKIDDDPVKHDNTTGTVTFAMGGPGTRTTQIFINFKDNKPLDKMGFAPFGIIKDMTNVNKLYSGYGEGAPRGQGPSQMLLQTKGSEYLKPAFPKMDYILNASIL